MAQIGVEGEISDVSLVRTVDMGGSEKVLYLEEKEDGWYLTSEKAFTDTFELKITVSGTVYVVTVTDTASTTNLNDLLKSFTVTGATQNPDGSYTVKPGKPYAVDIVFQESEQTSAFDDNGNLVFTVPQGLTLSNFTSPFDINVNEAGANFTVSGNTIVANGNTITIHFNQEDPNFSKLQGISTTELRVHGDVTFDNMTNGATYTVGTDGIFKVDSNPDVNIAKSGRIVDFEHGTVSYTLTVTSNGKNTGIIVTDTITGDALTLNQDVVMKDAGNNTLNPTVTYDGNQFVLQTGALNDGTYYINYTAQLDMDKLDADIWNNGSMGTGDDTNNRIEWLDKHQDYNIGHVVEAPRVEKRAGTATTDEATGVATIPWTIEADSNYYENWKLTEVTDTIKTAGMHYSGDGITVTITDHVTGNTVGTYTKTWTEMGVDPSTATGWTFDMSSLANNYQKYWHYKIEYTTEYDVSSYNSQVQVKNETTTTYDPDPHEGVGTVNPTHSNSTGISKSMENTSQTEVTWRITLGIPQGGLDAARAVVTEYLPSAGSYVDGYKAGSFRYVSGNLPGDGNPEITDNGDGTVTFRWLNGFAPNTEDGQRTLVFELKTTNNQDWMDDTSVTNNHKNHAEFDTGHGYADAFPVKPMFRKTGSNYQVVNDDLYFYFNVVTNNLNPEAIQQHGGLITFTDAFDSHLEYVEGSAKIYGGKDANNINATWQHCQLTPAISGNTMTFTVTVDDLPGENVYDSDSGSWIENPVKDFTFYKISYTMKVKDREALTEAALGSDAYTVVMGNTITSVLGSDSTTVEYTPKVLEKYKGNEVDGRIEFTIKVNEAKADLATGDVLVLTDTMHNLSAHYEDIHVAVQDYTTPVTMTNEAGQSVQLPYFNMKGDVITFYLPDNYETIITYTAMPVGEVDSNGYIHYNNVANLNGYEKEVDNWARYSGTAAGTATNYGVKLYKANGYINSQKLAGAKFKLYIVDEVDEDGNIVSGSPLKDNSTGKDYIVTSSDTGEVLVMGDVTVQGWNLKPEQRYYMLEVEAPEGCAIDNTKYEFVISQKGYANYTSRYVTAPDGSGAIIQPWTYYNGDVLTVKNYPIKGILDIKKTFEGINSATMDDNQKAAIRFEVYKQKNDGSWTKFKTIGYDEFVTDTYTIGDLDAGTYKVLEIVDDTTCQSTTYAVTHSADSVEASGQYVTVVVSEEDIRSVTHHEVNVNNTYDVPSEFKVYKYADYADNHLMTDMKLAGAEFGVFPYNAGDGTLGVQIGENYVTNSRGRFSVVPVDGSIVYDTVYALKEVKAPEGYQLSEQVYYFCFLGEGTSTLPSNAPANTVAIPYKTASTDQQIPNAFDTTTLGVRKLWQTDTLEEDTEKTDGVTVRILRSAYYNKAGTVLEESETGYFPAANSTFTVSYATDHWALSTEATLPTGVSIDASGRLTGLPTVKVLPNGALLYYKYTVEEAPVNGYNASYAYTTELDGSEQVTITNRPNSVKSMVKVHARKKWVDPAGNDVTSDMGLTDGVSLDVYRVAGVLNKGVVKQGTNEYDARALFPLTFSLSGDGTIDRTSMVCLPGDRLRVTIKPLEYNNSHTFADTDAVNINIRYYNGSYFEYTRDDVNEVLICDFDADNTKTGVEIAQNSGQYSFEATVENLSAVGRTQVLTQAEAASVGGTKVETLTLNKQNGWYDESEEYSSGSASTVYTYYVVEQNGSKTDATYTVDGDSVLVTNVDKKLKVDKKWLKADDTEISNKTDGTVEYTLYQSSAAIPTVNIDWAVTYGMTGWGQTPIDLTATGQKTGIKKGSNVTIKLSAPANNGNDGSLDLPDSFFTGGASITKGTYDGSVAERIYTINNIQHNVSIRGLLAASSAVAITAEITVDESTASEALAPTVTALGSITVGYNSIEANTVDSAYPVRVGNAPWSILISKLPSADDDHIFTYYVAETAINGFDTTYEPAGVGVAPGSTITVKNQKQPTGSLRIEKELQGLTYADLSAEQKAALASITFTVTGPDSYSTTITLAEAMAGKTLTDLPLGTYTVTETRPDGSTPDGYNYVKTTVQVNEGTATDALYTTAAVEQDTTTRVKFVNVYEPSTIDLTVKKAWHYTSETTTTIYEQGEAGTFIPHTWINIKLQKLDGSTWRDYVPVQAPTDVNGNALGAINNSAVVYRLRNTTGWVANYADLPAGTYRAIECLNNGNAIDANQSKGIVYRVGNSKADTRALSADEGVSEDSTLWVCNELVKVSLSKNWVGEDGQKLNKAQLIEKGMSAVNFEMKYAAGMTPSSWNSFGGSNVSIDLTDAKYDNDATDFAVDMLLAKYSNDGSQMHYKAFETTVTVNGVAVPAENLFTVTQVGTGNTNDYVTAAEGNTLTVTNTLPTVDIEVNKVWAPSSTWPENVESVTVQLQQSVNGATPTDVTGKTLTITAANSAANAETVDAAVGDEAKAAQRALIADRTFANLPKNDNAGNPITYSVVETAVTGTDVGLADFDISYSDTVTGNNGSIAITNTRKPGDLELSKKVAGEGADENKEFIFTIKLTAPEGGSLDDEYTVDKGETGVSPAPSSAPTELTWTEDTTKDPATLNTSREGTINVYLTHNQTVTVKDLPAGTAYEITEGDYSAEGYSASPTQGNLTGTITGGTTAKEAVEVTNTFTPGKLVVVKTVAGNGSDAEKVFSFQVVFQKENISGNRGSYKIGTTETIASVVAQNVVFGTDANPAEGADPIGQATVNFTLKGGEKAEFSNLPVGTTFTVSEISADQDGYVTTVETTGGTVAEKTVTGTISGSASVTASYTNTRNVGSLKLKKLITKDGETDNINHDYYFTLQPLDADGGTVGDPYYIKLWVTGTNYTTSDWRFMTKEAYDKGSGYYDQYNAENPSPNGDVIFGRPDSEGFAVISNLEPGDYLLTELNPNDGSIASIVRGDDPTDEGIINNDNRSVRVTVAAGDDIPATAMVTYTNNKVTKGSLEISKAFAEGAETAGTNQEFEFIVWLGKLDGNSVDWTAFDQNSVLVNDEEKRVETSGGYKYVVVTITGANNAIISNLPAGTVYEVYESGLDGWKQISMVDDDDKSFYDGDDEIRSLEDGKGSIAANETDHVTVTNDLLGGIKLKKLVKVDGNELTVDNSDPVRSRTYHFTVVGPAGDAPITRYVLAEAHGGGDEVATVFKYYASTTDHGYSAVDWYSADDPNKTTGDGPELTLGNLEPGQYTITEDWNNGVVDDMITTVSDGKTSSTARTITVNVTASATPSVEVTYTNDYVVGNLSLRKVAKASTMNPINGDNAKAAGTYKFTLVGPVDGSNQPVHGAITKYVRIYASYDSTKKKLVYSYEMKDEDAGWNRQAETSLDDSAGVNIDRLKTGDYLITERGWELETNTNGTVMHLDSISVSPEVDGVLVALNTDDKTLKVHVDGVNKTEIKAVFTNELVPNTMTHRKMVLDVNDSSDTDPFNSSTEQTWEDSADYDIGDHIPYRVTGFLPQDAYRASESYYYRIDDVMQNLEYVVNTGHMFAFVKGPTDVEGHWYQVDEYFTIEAPSTMDAAGAITSDGNDAIKYLRAVTKETAGLKAIARGYLTTWGEADTHKNDQKAEPTVANSTTSIDPNHIQYLQFRYKAELLPTANIGTAGNANDAKVYYDKSANPQSTGWDRNRVFTYKILINKTYEEDDATRTESATFALYKRYITHSPVAHSVGIGNSSGTTLYAENAANLPTVTAPATKVYPNDNMRNPGNYYYVGETDADPEHNTFEWTGLDDGYYILVELSAPEGYIQMSEPIQFAIVAAHDQEADDPTLNLNGGGTYVNVWPESMKSSFRSDTVTTVFNGGAITGNITNKPYLIDIKIEKVVAGSSTALNGAVFELYRKTGQNAQGEPLWDKTVTANKYGTDVNSQFTVNGSETLTNLKDGTYQIREVDAPTGYIITSKTPVTFTILHGEVVPGSNVLTTGVTYTAKRDAVEAQGGEPAQEATLDTFTIPNEPGVALPATGGVGTGVIYGAGAALLLLAVLGLILLNRKRTDGEGIR